jgi:hypothetical protein
MNEDRGNVVIADIDGKKITMTMDGTEYVFKKK